MKHPDPRYDIRELSQLERLFDAPVEVSLAKEIDHVDENYAAWIAAAPLGPRELALRFAAVYVGCVAISVVAAHVLEVVVPHSAWARRLAAPVVTGLAFLDAHWRAIVIIAAPFVAPIALDLIPRLRKAGSFEFDAVPLESIGVRQKPAPQPPGA